MEQNASKKHTGYFVFISKLAGKTANRHMFQLSTPFEDQSNCGSSELSRDMNGWFADRKCGVVDHSIDSTIRDFNSVCGLWIEMLLCDCKKWRKGLALRGPQVDP